MYFEQKTDPQAINGLKEQVESILGSTIASMTSSFVETGASGNTNILSLVSEGGQSRKFILKHASPDEIDFYNEVLYANELFTPQYFGALHDGEDSFMLTEFVPHERPDWSKQDQLLRGIDLLIAKDLKVQANLAEIHEHPLVMDLHYDLEDWLELVSSTAYFSTEYISLLESKMSYIGEVLKLLSLGQQTLIHHDFKIGNILFGTENMAGHIYLIDWTEPVIGSVIFDLFKFVFNNDEIRWRLIDRYRDIIGIPEFPILLQAAKVYFSLRTIQWFSKILNEGQKQILTPYNIRRMQILQDYLIGINI